MSLSSVPLYISRICECVLVCVCVVVGGWLFAQLVLAQRFTLGQGVEQVSNTASLSPGIFGR